MQNSIRSAAGEVVARGRRNGRGAAPVATVGAGGVGEGVRRGGMAGRDDRVLLVVVVVVMVLGGDKKRTVLTERAYDHGGGLR